jgi:hypothetical protein
VDLRDLRLPASQESQAPLRALARLRRLGSLQILCMLDVDNANGYWPSRVAECAPEMLALAAANSGLRRLAGPGALAGVLAPPVLGGLREIELWDVRAMRPAEFEQLFANTPALERLALAELTNCQDVMPVLVRHAGAFPRLHAFKLISGDLLHEDHTLADIATFIRAQPALTMCVRRRAAHRWLLLTSSAGSTSTSPARTVRASATSSTRSRRCPGCACSGSTRAA